MGGNLGTLIAVRDICGDGKRIATAAGQSVR